MFGTAPAAPPARAGPPPAALPLRTVAAASDGSEAVIDAAGQVIAPSASRLGLSRFLRLHPDGVVERLGAATPAHLREGAGPGPHAITSCGIQIRRTRSLHESHTLPKLHVGVSRRRNGRAYLLVSRRATGVTDHVSRTSSHALPPHFVNACSEVPMQEQHEWMLSPAARQVGPGSNCEHVLGPNPPPSR